MRNNFLNPFYKGNSVDDLPDRPYLPYPVAKEAGAVSEENIIVREIDESVGVIISRGKKPQPRDAGVIRVGNDTFAVDHGRLVGLHNGKVVIGPTSKNAVGKSGDINEEGILTITDEEGRVKFLGAVINRGNPWTVYDRSFPNDSKVFNTAGKLAVVMFGLEAPMHEIVDTDTKSGTITTKEIQKYF